MSTTQIVDHPALINAPALHFTLDLRCPITLPHRPAPNSAWPFAESSTQARQRQLADVYLRQRWLETLYLPEVLASVQQFAEDAQRVATTGNALAGIRPLLRSLPNVEQRHRKLFRLYIDSIVSAGAPKEDDDGEALEGVESDERGALRFGIELRCSSRATEDGKIVNPRKLVEELERRETLLQIILLFLIVPLVPAEPEPKNKRKRRRDGGEAGSSREPAQDPAGALELMMDRLGVWHAVAELGIEVDDTAPQAKVKASRTDAGIQGVLRRFWESVIVPLFLPSQLDLASTFHAKVFGHPIPPRYLPEQASSKKPRKPKLTHARPSADSMAAPARTIDMAAAIPAPLSSYHQPLRPTSSRPPSEVSMRLSPPRELSVGDPRQRSLSRASTDREPLRRSRSRSMDPQAALAQSQSANLLAPPAKRPIIRAPSSKDLFKGREVGLMRRTASMISRKERDPQSQAQIQTQMQGHSLGLLGRKTSDPIRPRRGSNDDTHPHPPRAPNAIIMATPVRARTMSGPGLFGARPPAPTFFPTPIQEEPGSARLGRQAFVAETPVGHRRVDTAPLQWSGVMETPMMPSRHSDPGLLSHSLGKEEDEGDGSDQLGDFMDMTDEEEEWDEGPSEGVGRHIVPETPAR